MGGLTLPRLSQLHRSWKRHPPLSLLIRSAIGWEAPKEERVEAVEGTSSEDRARMDAWLDERLKNFGGMVVGQIQEARAQ